MAETITYYPVVLYPAEPFDDHSFAVLQSLDGKVIEAVRGIEPKTLGENFLSAMRNRGINNSDSYEFLYIPPTNSLTIDEIAGEPPRIYTVKHMIPEQIQQFKRGLRSSR